MKKLPWIALIAAASAALSSGASAEGLRPDWVYVQGGLAEHGTVSATVGVAWPWSWRTELSGAELTGQTEFYASHWSAEDFGSGRQSLTQLGLVPVLRIRFGQGRSDWFLEGGIGVSWLDKTYHTPDKRFSTAGNFHDMFGVGRSFGPGRSRELSLRLVHYSNAGVKKPNPGADFLQLRYGVKF